MANVKRLVALVLVLLALNVAPASAHTPNCDDKYPWFQYRTTVHSIVLGTLYYWYYNASTGATHKHVCYGWQ
jgi:hypothetical protein